jgi:hypothetical protein
MRSASAMEMLILIVGALIIAAVVYGSVTKAKWGINIHPAQTCPVCGTPFAKFPRRPANLAESLWGGNICGKCGTRIDKWGRQIGGGESRLAG